MPTAVRSRSLGAHRAIMRLGAALLCLATVCSTALAGTTYYVRASGNDSANGLSPARAFKTIQKAVSLCTSAGNTIQVGPGSYPEQVFVGKEGGRHAQDGAPGQPNRIVGDITGAATGDPAGAVVIDGGGREKLGLAVDRRAHWSFEHLTFKNQKKFGVRAKRSSSIQVKHCTVDQPSDTAISITDGENNLVEGNTIVRERNDAGFGIYVYASGGSQHIVGNRFSLLGDNYLASGLSRAGQPSRRNSHNDEDEDDDDADERLIKPSRKLAYGIVALTQKNACAQIMVENNVGSDCYMGIYAFASGERASAKVVCNTMAGCTFGFYGYTAKHGTITFSDNIAGTCYYGMLANGQDHGRVAISGLLTPDSRGQSVLRAGSTSLVGHLEGQDPLWISPLTGNFALASGSPAIEAGLGAVATATDIRGVFRPYDADHDGQAEYDLGAYEFDPSVDGGAPRLVTWNEVEPD